MRNSKKPFALMAAFVLGIAGILPAGAAPVSMFTNSATPVVGGLNEVASFDSSAAGDRTLVLSRDSMWNSGALSVLAGGVAYPISSDLFTHAEITGDGQTVIASDPMGSVISIDITALDGSYTATDITPSIDLDADSFPEVTGVSKFGLSADGNTIVGLDSNLPANWLKATKSGGTWTWSLTSNQLSLPLAANLDQSDPDNETPESVDQFAITSDGALFYAVTNFARVVRGVYAAGDFTLTQVVSPRATAGAGNISISSDGSEVIYSVSDFQSQSSATAYFSKTAGETTPTWIDVMGLDLDLGVGSDYPLTPDYSTISSDGSTAVVHFSGGTLAVTSNLSAATPGWKLVGSGLSGVSSLGLSANGTVLTIANDPDFMDQADGNAILLSQPTPITTFEGAWYPAGFPGVGEQAIHIMDGETSDYVPSHINLVTPTGTFLCDNSANQFGGNADVLGDPAGDCSEAAILADGNSLTGRVLLEPCPADSTDPSADFCIESISIGSSTPSAATFNRVSQGPRFSAESELGDEAGGTVSLWSSSHLNSGGTGTYAANVAVTISPVFNEDQTQFLGIEYTGISATVTPYVESPNFGTLSVSDLTIDEMSDGGNTIVAWSGGDGPRCAFAEDNMCGRIVDFTAGTKVSMAVRVPTSVGGFFKGRLKAPAITVAPLAGDLDSQVITVTAEPVKVPRLVHTFDTTDPDVLTEVVRDGQSTQDLFQLDSDLDGFADDQVMVGWTASQQPAFDLVEWLKQPGYANDTISGYNTLWSFGTTGNQADPNDSAYSCLADTTQVLGVVTSNAMVYQDAPPTISLDGNGDPLLGYQVAGMHFEPNGTTEVLGTYDMLLDSQVARCLYPDLANVAQGQLSADISISEGATVKSASVSVSEADGWLELSAYGFTFSTNTVSVGLRQAQSNSGSSGSSGSAPEPVVPAITAPPVVAVPAIATGQSGAVLIGGQPANVTIGPTTSGALEIKGTDWSLGVAPDSAGTSPLNAKGELVLNPEGSTDLSGSGFQANSKASAFLIPRGATEVASLGITQANLRKLSTPISLGAISVDAKGSFAANLDLSAAKGGSYILQINGAAPDGKIRSISVAANVLDVALKGWTKKLTPTQVKVYAKNVVGKGKIQFLLNGKEVAWVRAVDGTDSKLRTDNGSSYLVRTLNLAPGKNRFEILVDGKRERLTTYTR